MNGLMAFLRLVAAGWTLARVDALIPRELNPVLPPNARLLGNLVRLFAGPKARQGRPGQRLAGALEGMGPVAIKLGQFLSTRADIFGKEFADDLSHLKDRLPPFPHAEAQAEVERALDRPIGALFSEFGPAVAAASLAQAHQARLLDGRRVAVKVLRPGIERRVAEEAASLTLAAKLVDAFVPPARRLEPRAFAAVVLRAMMLELDLRFEAAGGDELGEVAAKDGYMRCPPVIWEGVGKRVLTLGWADGVALSDPASLTLDGLDRPRLADNIVRGFLAQALGHGVFHADLHEGNLFVAAPAEVTAIDFGIVGRLGSVERRYLAEILWGFLNRDYPRIAQVHFDAGYVPAGQDVDAFAQALRAVGEPVFGRNASQVSMGRLLAQLFEITALFEMRLRPELVLLQKTMVTVEGVARRIYPDHDLWAAAKPVVQAWIARELSPVAKARDFTAEALRAIKALARLAETPPTPAVAVVETPSSRAGLGFALGAAVAGLAFLLAVWLT
ncbi:MAG: 2-polyprenylphenol 6-hydroxylase [Caulobacterales bacterium]|nr:2-polyprenylphenol 6-hydroxylase [Caulobacterales bacterium]